MNMQKTDQKELFPEVGELVIGKIVKVTQTGVDVSVNDYPNWKCFIHTSDVTLGYVRNIRWYLKEKQKKVLIVKRINKTRKEIDLSLKQVTREQKKQKLTQQKNLEKAEGLLKNIAEKGKFSQDQTNKLEDKLLINFSSLYDAFSEIIKNDISSLNNCNISSKEKTVISQVIKQIRKPKVEIIGNLTLSTVKSDGIELIKKILLDIINQFENNVDITYIGAPIYQLKITATDFKKAEEILEDVLNHIQKKNKKNLTSIDFERKRSKKYVGF